MKKVFVLIFVLLVFPVFSSASVIINEIAWMGAPESANNEWLELFNNGSEAMGLDGWILEAIDGTPKINLSGSVSAGGFFLLERTDDSVLPGISADLIYTGALSNSGEILILKNAAGAEIDRVDGSDYWESIGGDNNTKQTAQRTAAGWITATSTPKATNISLTQAPASQSSQESQPSQTQTPAASPSSSVSVPTQTIPQIKAYAGEDKNVITGAEVKFSGLALGLKDEPIDNAGFIWTFGDGDFKEGRVVNHIYQFPGNYLAVLDISSGQYSASDRVAVKVNKAELLISEIKPGEAGWIEIQNKSREELDISGLKIKQASQSFSFPRSTFIQANSIIVVPESASKIKLTKEGEVGLFYSNSFLIEKFSYQGILKEGESFNRAGEGRGSYIVKETSGAENIPIPTSDVGIKGIKNASNVKKPESKQSSSTSISVLNVGFKEPQAKPPATESLQQPAAVEQAEPNENKNWLFWFLISLGIGVLGAIGFLFYRRKIRDGFQID